MQSHRENEIACVRFTSPPRGEAILFASQECEPFSLFPAQTRHHIAQGRYSFCLIEAIELPEFDSDTASVAVFVEEECDMKVIGAALAFSVLAIGSASAQVPPPLSGTYQCIQNCAGPGLAYVTQNGWDLNLVNEVGAPSRAWVDYPGHIYAEYYHEGAVFSPDGFRIQFDNGAVWQRFVPLPPPPPPPPRVHSRG
jgi:hypothetical protein